ncbi:PA2169 family four-helix-bundle protein [Paraburkholderia hospita]|uniref:PA2169 family four-helix-bundle protein n=1 Tax=Paraburkholderia hospita TaxID=169430 RepID=UPI000B345372|nr:PA2169 family four-helix-bundle protein [Paraburkholderia hospita]OUL95363.1 aldehyde dehydrogenase [Paraburkholderia hospita]
MTTNVIAVLNGLIETSKDGERDFMKTAEDANHASVKDALLESAERCTRGARELQDLVLKLGGKPEGGGSVAGALHRGWLDVKSAVGSRTDHAILADCEKGEDAAKKRFHEALEKDLPADVRAVVERLYHGVLQNHDRIRAMRDQYAAMKA